MMFGLNVQRIKTEFARLFSWRFAFLPRDAL